MIYKNYKDKKISQMGFGAMRFQLLDDNNRNIDTVEAEKMIMEAYNKGVNYFDTSYVYHGGNSEVVLGEIIKKNNIRDKIYIADKLPTFSLTSYSDNYKYLFEELNRLQVDYLDFFLVHTLDYSLWENVKKYDVLKFLDQIKKDGLVKEVGFSFHEKYDLFEEIIDAYPWDFCQIQLNILDENFQAGLKGLEYARSKNIPVIIMEPLKGGRITSIKDDFVNTLFEKYDLKDKTLVEICLRYIYNKEGILTVLNGVNTLVHTKENIKTASTSPVGCLTDNEKGFIEEFKNYIQDKIYADCTGCKYCEDKCPLHLPIARAIELLNHGYIFGDWDKCKSGFGEIKDKLPCTDCKLCNTICPQHLDVPALIEKTKELLS